MSALGLPKLAYTIEEAAELLGTTASFVRDAVTARRIPHRTLGKDRVVRFTVADLQAFLDAHAVPIAGPVTHEDVVQIGTKRRRRAA